MAPKKTIFRYNVHTKRGMLKTNDKSVVIDLNIIKEEPTSFFGKYLLDKENIYTGGYGIELI